MAIDLSALSAREALTAIYIGYYDRAADPAGIQFWEQVVSDTSLDLVAITSDFAGQAETQSVHPFFADPATSSPATFITSLYQNLFNRDPDEAGLTFWSDALQDAIDGVEGAISVGQIITSIIEGAVDVEGGTQDRTTILNKIEVGLDWTEAAEAAEIDYTSNAAAQASAKSIIEGVTDDADTVTAAKSTTDDFFEDTGGNGGGTPGDEFLLSSDTDVITGTENDDEFNAYIAQNPFVGGVSNTLSSADRVDGGAGNDRMYAEVVEEFVGTDGDDDIDIQPRLTDIEEIDVEAREGEGSVTVDGKNIVGHEELSSYYSDADLKFENVTTLTSGGTARNTSEITVGMDHTDNFNTDEDASDLEVLFDNDYLLSGQESEGEIRYFLLDEDAELAGLDDRLDNIDVDGLRFNIFDADGTVTAVVLEDIAANTAGTHQGFVNALQPALQALIADGTLPAGTTLTLNPALTDFTFLDDGSRSDDIPAIVLMSGDGSRIEATGFSRIQEEIGEYDVYGRFESRNETQDQPISVDIELQKAGRGGEGGDLVVGGKSENTSDNSDDGIADGIEVFNIEVLGAGAGDAVNMSKPSNVGTITSTGDELSVVNITTAPEFAAGSTYASLTVRNGFDQDRSDDVESGDLMMINADGFLGDLTLGDIDAANNAGRITNADTITAQGGGDVTLGLRYDGDEVNEDYSVTTGGGNDDIDVIIDGDALDYADSSLNIATNDGDDRVAINFNLDDFSDDGDNEQLNQAVLDNVNVETGAGNDVIDIDDVGNANIDAGTGNDVVYTDGNGNAAIWAFNFDAVRAAAQGGIDANGPDDLPGVQTSLAYLSNAQVTVTLSGAGIDDLTAGGGVMADGDPSDDGADRFSDGYESSARINSLNNGNEHFGDQTDVNDAVVRAINNDPVLGNLLTASIGANNTLVVVSNTSGDFDVADLRIDIAQETYTTSSYAGSVLSEARSVFGDSSITNADLFGGTTASSAYVGGGNGYGADLTTSALADAWYDGLSARGDDDNSTTLNESNLHTAGSASNAETDNVINGNAGDDLIVLSTAAESDGSEGSFTAGGNNSLINGASNETIELSGSDFGDDTVMNFTTAGGLEDDTSDDLPFDALDADGVDFLDFTAYLTSMEDVSPNTGAGDTSDSFNMIDVTLDTDTSDVAANEVAVFTYDPTSGTDFDNLSGSAIASLFNNSDGTGNYDGLSDTAFSVAVDTTSDEVVGGASKAIVMVENADNDGEYKVFELSWNSSDTPATQSHAVTATDIGSLDFGDSLDGLTELNLIGSNDYDNLLDNGFAAAMMAVTGA